MKNKFYYYFRVTLIGRGGSGKNSKDKIFREIAVLGRQTLSTLASTIVRSFNFYFDHCYGFYNSFDSYINSTEMYELFTDIPEEPTPGAKGVTRIKVATIFPEIGKKMLFLFDYGDNWKFSVLLIEIKVAPGNAKNPKIIKKVGKAPKQYPLIEENDFGEEIHDGHDLFHADCDLCNKLQNQGITSQWFSAKPISKKRIIN